VARSVRRSRCSSQAQRKRGRKEIMSAALYFGVLGSALWLLVPIQTSFLASAALAIAAATLYAAAYFAIKENKK